MSRELLEAKILELLIEVGGPPREGLQEWVQKAVAAGMIPKEQLEDGKYYFGECRNTSVAKWVAAKNRFEYVRSKFGDEYIDHINHPSDDDGYDLFIPIKEIEPCEREIVD